MSQAIISTSVRSFAAAPKWHAFTTTAKHHASSTAAYKNFAAYTASAPKAGCGTWSPIG